MTKYFKRKKPISYLAQVKNQELEVYMDTYNDLEVYEEETTEAAEYLGDFDYNKYSEEE